jgi:hypothetical protein
MSKVCESTICVEKYSEGFAFVIQNEGPNIATKVDPTLSQGDGLGYAGLPSGVAIEFDFSESPSLNEPSYPHISVQYR